MNAKNRVLANKKFHREREFDKALREPERRHLHLDPHPAISIRQRAKSTCSTSHKQCRGQAAGGVEEGVPKTEGVDAAAC